jgi:hypothetical protein
LVLVAGDVVTIDGENFGDSQDAVTVTVGGTAADVLSVAETTITARVAASLAGSLQLDVRVGGRTASGPTLTVVPNRRGSYAVAAQVVDNPCDIQPEADDLAADLSEMAWTATQTATQLTLAVGTLAWAGAFEGSAFTSQLTVEDGDLDLDLTFQGAGATGTLLLAIPGNSCTVRLGLDAERTQAGGPRAAGERTREAVSRLLSRLRTSGP